MKLIRELSRSLLVLRRNIICKRNSSYDIDLKIGDLNLNKYINTLQQEFQNLTSKNLNGKRLLELRPIIDILDERKNTVDNITNLSDLLNEKDSDIKKLAQEEKLLFERCIQSIDEALKLAILPNDEEDDINGIVLEVNAGVGGQEAMLFANEVFQMYSNFVAFKGWEHNLAEYLTTEKGGIRHASLLINGRNAFKYFKYEAGVHRVQRNPATEKSGRIHTSTVSVLALPQPDDIEINLQNKDLKIETKRATGAGGQHVNTTDSAVRIVHLPTGIAVECQTNRSQIKNREFAMQRLKAKLYEQQLQAQTVDTLATRKSQVRTNFRNEKIRTYNFSQDRITDHRLNGVNFHNIKVFMMGGEPLDELIEQLDYSNKIERLTQIVNELE